MHKFTNKEEHLQAIKIQSLDIHQTKNIHQSITIQFWSYGAVRNGTFDLAEHHLLMSGVLVLYPFQLFL